MTNQFKEVSTIGYGNRILNSITGIALGFVLFVASFFVLYWNEGRQDASEISKTASPVDATTSSPQLNGKLVAVNGILDSKNEIGDDLFLKPGKYIALQRVTEMYAWVEEMQSNSQVNLGGSETLETTYSYKKDWVEEPVLSGRFRHPEGHENLPKSVKSDFKTASEASVGVYRIDVGSLTLPSLQPLTLDATNTIPAQGASLADSSYLFLGKSEKSSFADPQIGDLRIRYRALFPGTRVTVLGKLEGNIVEPYFHKGSQRLYRLFQGSPEEATAALQTEHKLFTWFLRGAGFFLMWIGLSMVFGPISVLLDVLPILGAVSRAVVSGVAFLVALLLTFATIALSKIFHNPIALTLVVATGLGFLIFSLLQAAHKKKKALS